MVAAKANQHVRRFRTQVIHIYDDEDDDDGWPNISDYYHEFKTLLKTRCRDQRKRRKWFAGVLLLLMVLLVMVQTVLTNGDVGQSAPPVMATVHEESILHNTQSQIMKLQQQHYNSTTSLATHTLSDVSIPEPFDTTIADISEPFEKGRDMPYFFHIPRAAGSTVKDILGGCAYVRIAWNATATLERLKHAKDMQLVQSGQVDVVTTQYLHAGATLFDGQQHRGRCFTLFRHPIERAVSLFHYLGIASHEPTYDPQLKYISLEMWARSKRIEHNWMVRFLSNELVGDLTPRHLDIAKEVLRRKCLVGLLEEKTGSFLRFQKFFGWQFYNEEMHDCQDKILNWHWSNKHKHDLVEEGSPEWELLYKQNILDMELYNYAKQLYVEQRSLFESD
jgi:hypothetical protein